MIKEMQENYKIDMKLVQEQILKGQETMKSQNNQNVVNVNMENPVFNINYFGCEGESHIHESPNKNSLIIEFLKGHEGLRKYIEFTHFNPDIPRNRNIRKKEKEGEIEKKKKEKEDVVVEVFKPQGWTDAHIGDVVENVIDNFTMNMYHLVCDVPKYDVTPIELKKIKETLDIHNREVLQPLEEEADFEWHKCGYCGDMSAKEEEKNATIVREVTLKTIIDKII
jgi:hypothetical protein